MSMVPEMIVRRRLTLDDYLALPDDQDYEIIDGVLYVAPRPTSHHQLISARLTTLLVVNVEDRDLGTVIPDADLIVDERNTYFSPDIMVFLGDRFAKVDRNTFIRIIPDLIVEVLSPSTTRRDQIVKRRTYASLSVPHYWIVDPSDRTIVEHTLQPNGEYQERRIGADEQFQPSGVTGLVIDVGRLFR
ncbi:MAG TPA: Uma2 family endonuclease [Chloroflexota bacterium]|nr:Uma2 family endonuclease [Chloroflexota bacterium]